jgi:hypothetical protein
LIIPINKIVFQGGKIHEDGETKNDQQCRPFPEGKRNHKNPIAHYKPLHRLHYHNAPRYLQAIFIRLDAPRSSDAAAYFPNKVFFHHRTVDKSALTLL